MLIVARLAAAKMGPGSDVLKGGVDGCLNEEAHCIAKCINFLITYA